jgi:hypothetical protein
LAAKGGLAALKTFDCGRLWFSNRAMSRRDVCNELYHHLDVRRHFETPRAQVARSISISPP